MHCQHWLAGRCIVSTGWQEDAFAAPACREMHDSESMPVHHTQGRHQAIEVMLIEPQVSAAATLWVDPSQHWLTTRLRQREYAVVNLVELSGSKFL